MPQVSEQSVLAARVGTIIVLSPLLGALGCWPNALNHLGRRANSRQVDSRSLGLFGLFWPLCCGVPLCTRPQCGACGVRPLRLRPQARTVQMLKGAGQQCRTLSLVPLRSSWLIRLLSVSHLGVPQARALAQQKGSEGLSSAQQCAAVRSQETSTRVSFHSSFWALQPRPSWHTNSMNSIPASLARILANSMQRPADQADRVSSRLESLHPANSMNLFSKQQAGAGSRQQEVAAG